MLSAQTAVVSPLYWRLVNVKRSSFSPEYINTQHLRHLTFPINADPQRILNSMGGRGVVQMGRGVGQLDSLWQLYRVIRDRVRLGLSSGDFVFAIWQRLLQPVMSIFMLLQAVPIIFKSFGRVVLGKTIITSLFIAFFVYILNQFIGPLCLLMNFPVLLAALIPIIMIASCYALMTLWVVSRK